MTGGQRSISTFAYQQVQHAAHSPAFVAVIDGDIAIVEQEGDEPTDRVNECCPHTFQLPAAVTQWS